MAVNMIVEDGSGKSDANSYASIADVDEYWANRNDTVWAAYDDETKKASLVKATQHLEANYEWSTGVRRYRAQSLGWPRLDAYDRDGYWIEDDIVPQAVIAATCELAFRDAGGTALAPDQSGPRVVSEQVDVISVTYDANSTTQTTFTLVEGILAGLVYSSMGIMGATVRS